MVPTRKARGNGNELLAEEILSYLQSRPDAADTLEGLVKWWLARQRLIEEESKVLKVLEELYDAGMIGKRTLADGSVIYLANKKMQ